MPPALERQLALVTLLSEKSRGLSRTAIASALPHFYPASDDKALEASRKKLQRDAEALTAMGMPIA
jgi:predicted DNA-binding transcriptional regulator YafY